MLYSQRSTNMKYQNVQFRLTRVVCLLKCELLCALTSVSYLVLKEERIGTIPNIKGQNDALIGTTRIAIHTEDAVGKDKPSKFII